jgi:CDP-glucose 4,6-dehydratase
MNELKKFYNGKRILITGHAGFKGSWLSNILINWGAEIIGYSLEPNTSPNLFETLELKSKIINYFNDIRDIKKLKEVIYKEKPEIIFHMAAQPLVRNSYDDPIYTYQTNIIGTANILEAVKESKSVKSVIIITTDKVYENIEKETGYVEDDRLGGYDPYSTSKACAELITGSYVKSFFNPKDYLKKHNLLVSSVRAGNVIGGGDWSKDRLIPDIIKGIFEKEEDIIIRNPNAIRPWQHVLEPLTGYLILARKLYDGEIKFVGAWNFAPEEENFITVEELIKNGINILEKGNYKINTSSEKHETMVLKLDATKAKNNLNWKPSLNVSKTLKITFDWYKEFYNNKDDIINYTNKQINDFMERL